MPVRRRRKWGRRAAAVLALVALAAAAWPTGAAARAVEIPDDLASTAARLATDFGQGEPAWARYVVTTPPRAASLLGVAATQLTAGIPDRLFLVVMRGRFVMAGRSGEYFAFLYWRAGESWNASDLTVRQRPFQLASAGTLHTLALPASADPTVRALRDILWVFLVVVLAPLLLSASAALCVWRRRRGWPYVVSACLLAAVACLQVLWAVLAAADGYVTWDWFWGLKFGTLALVLAVDGAAAAALLVARSRREAVGPAARGAGLLWRGVLLQVAAAVLYVVSLPWLGSTGA